MFKKIIYGPAFYFSRIFYITAIVIITLFACAFFFQPLLIIAKVFLLGLIIITFTDFLILYFKRKPISAGRYCADRFSNGDDNKIHIEFINNLNYKVHFTFIDEVPVQFQLRNFEKEMNVNANQTGDFVYVLKPLERGEYKFGIINIFLYGPLNMLIRHIKSGEEKSVAVYPSYIQMRRFHLMAITNQLQQTGSVRLRKIGNSLEFEQIKEYVIGDDYRTINWKASARRNSIMVNNFTDERSQQVICLIDKCRTMKMPFEGMTLLDYAINATLALSNIILLKQDKVGLLTFGKKIDQFVYPDKKPTQISLIQETLYRQQTEFLDSDFDALYTFIRYRIKQRGLLILFTNFESIYGMERQLPFLIQIASHHALLVVFFENTELLQLQTKKANSLEEIYNQTIANKFAFEKRQIVKELQKHGIMVLLTPPQKLTANTINKYMEIKARQLL